MAIPIIEKVLGTSNPYTAEYISNTIRLAKSIVTKSDVEATMYNELVEMKYGIPIDMYDRKSWRYYKHLNREYYSIDIPMEVISRDNKELIVLDKKSLTYHTETKAALNRYDEFFEEVVEQYPEQELLLRMLIANNDPIPIDEILELPRWSIVGYNEQLVEKNEVDLIYDLEVRIMNYGRQYMNTQYSIVDSLYMASLMCNLANFIVLNIIAVRLDNYNTKNVHSYPLLQYFASHHELDVDYPYLDDKQRMWLYRELKFLDMHAGSNETFDTLIERLFTYKRISIVNYVYNQYDEKLEDKSMEFGFTQELLNSIPFVYDPKVYSMEELASKEIAILNRNKYEYEFNGDYIDYQMKNSLASNALTKDLEISMTDGTNQVKHSLYNILIDYWATTIHLKYNNILIDFIDPISGKDLFMDNHDSFKLFYVTLCMHLGVELTCIPDYEILRAFKNPIPPTDELKDSIFRPTPKILDEIEDIRVKVPSYIYLDTRRVFRRFIERIYKFELGMEIYLGSSFELYSHYDYANAFENMHQSYILDNGQEDIDDFLTRIDFKELLDYRPDQVLEVHNRLLGFVSDDILEFNEINRLTQQAMTHIFNQFRSYTVQMLSDYNSENPLIGNIGAIYYGTRGSQSQGKINISLPNELGCIKPFSCQNFRYEQDPLYFIKGFSWFKIPVINTNFRSMYMHRWMRVPARLNSNICVSRLTRDDL